MTALDETEREDIAQPPPSSTAGATGSTQALPLQIFEAMQSAVVAHEVLHLPELSQV